MFAKVTRVLVLTVAVLAALANTGPPGTAHAAAPAGGENGVVFSYDAPDAQAVFLAGDFNNWNAQDLALVKQDGGTWTISVALEPGSYEYKFIVDGDWREDPDNPDKKSDPFGGSNSLVTIDAEGAVVAAAAAATPAASSSPAAGAALPADLEVGAPVAVEGGILFTYRDAGAGSVTLAGSFNGWDAQSLALTNDGDGNWSIIHDLGQGEHEYKFVVDGAWFADPSNPDTKSDPYGGVNSLVVVDGGGNLIAAPERAEDDGPAANTDLSEKLHLSGRYLTRFEFAKNMPVEVGDDPATDTRWRLGRPTQSVDLNFQAEVSPMASTYMRMRLDSDENIIQNNIAAFLDEANIFIHPENFELTAYWNQETYTSSDLLMLGGNIDHEGTIAHDHLDYGKGSAGALFYADPLGVRTELFFANVHNHDYYDDPELYDNTGEDKFGLRLSKRFGAFEIGTPVWMERSLVWLDFGTEVGLPSTGIPALDEHRARTNDTSTWYETESKNYNYGLDLRVNLGSKFMIGGQGSYVDLGQRFVTGNEAGQNNQNGQIDVPFLERDRIMTLGQIDYYASETMDFSLKYITADMEGADADQRRLSYEFMPQDVANKQIYFTINESPALVAADSTDFTWNWRKDTLDLGVWVRHTKRDYDYGAAGRTVPLDSTLTSATENLLKATLLLGVGHPGGFFGHGEIEFAYTDDDLGVADTRYSSYELIFRYDRDLTRNTGLIADLRFIKYDNQWQDDAGDAASESPDYFNPFAGFRYTPIRQLDLTLAYGVDPMDYSIAYSGRQMGRWWFRENYLFDHPEATLQDAERFLADAQTITLRAQLIF